MKIEILAEKDNKLSIGGFPIEIETQISKLIAYFCIIKIAKLLLISLLILVSISIRNPLSVITLDRLCLSLCLLVNLSVTFFVQIQKSLIFTIPDLNMNCSIVSLQQKFGGFQQALSVIRLSLNKRKASQVQDFKPVALVWTLSFLGQWFKKDLNNYNEERRGIQIIKYKFH